MAEVGIVGGGKAGAAAAREAARQGSSVSVFEKSTSRHLERRSLPIFDGNSRTRTFFGERVVRVGPGASVRTAERSIEFDSVVVATGSVRSFPVVKGLRLKGTHLVHDEAGFAELAGALPGIQMAVISGEPSDALAAADKVRGKGRSVTVFIRDWPASFTRNPAVVRVIEDAASDFGVKILPGVPSRVVGLSSAEAVVVDGRIHPCDAYVGLPSTTPSIPLVDVGLSLSGRILVDHELRTSSQRLFAAGSCAQLKGSGERHLLSPMASGAVAGANASGGRAAYRAAGSWSATIFGHRVVMWGAEPQDAFIQGRRISTAHRDWGPGSTCTVVYDEVSHSVLGVQLVVPSPGASSPAPLPLDDRLDLVTLAYLGGEGSSDISPISETARQGIRWGGTRDGESDSLRPRRR